MNDSQRRDELFIKSLPQVQIKFKKSLESIDRLETAIGIDPLWTVLLGHEGAAAKDTPSTSYY